MTQRRAVVSGASIAGLSAAYWLSRTGWEVLVLEKAPAFRDGGQNVDVRGVGRDVLRRMGLFEAVRERNTTETGTVLVDERGRVHAELPSDGPDGATAELEVLRGDLALVLRDALPDRVEIRYDDTVAAVEERDSGVLVRCASGEEVEAGLLVVAEGVRSPTRELVFDDVEVRELDIDMAFGTLERTADDDDRWRWLITTGGRQVHLRPDDRGTTRAILACSPGEGLAGLGRDDVARRLEERFAGVGWEAPRVLDGLATSDDLYVDSLAQVRVPSWHRDHVVLLGDAAWCVTPMGGAGASLALTGGYVLAASLSTAGDLATGLAAYDAWMRPLVDDAQSLPRAVVRLAYPRTRLGLRVNRLVTTVATSRPVRGLTSRMSRTADSDRELPGIELGAAA